MLLISLKMRKRGPNILYDKKKEIQTYHMRKLANEI